MDSTSAPRRRRQGDPSSTTDGAPPPDRQRPRRQPLPTPPPPLQTASSSSISAQVGGQSVINHAYTDLPWRLLLYDIALFFRLAWALPYIVWPVVPVPPPAGSGALAELAWTPANAWCIAVHAVLAVLQLAFLLGGVPAACVLLPVWMAAALGAAALGANHVLCRLLLNSVRGTIEFHSRPECAAARPEHAHEQWVFLNGVAVGQHWMQSNLDRLALTFGRPVLGIHNRTAGIVFDVIECLVQRNFTYATRDVRDAYDILKRTLYRPDIRRVVFLLHSQGGIEGGLVLDWLLQELPQDLLAKLEVYTFGNAANHCNNPHRTADAQRRGLLAAATAADTDATTAAPGTAIGHVEHYAHTTDFVALWGVLHFARSVPGSHSMPRYLGRVFARSAAGRGGHQFCQHYLDGMFPLARDARTGAVLGCADAPGANAFMESAVAVGRAGDDSADVRKAFERSWLAALRDAKAPSPGSSGAAAVEIHSGSPVLVRPPSQLRPVQVKDVSRLWQYRNGRSPDEGRLHRLATM